jgi:ABC-type multidrug transport system fused ATPase/permease subunit
VLAIFSKDQDTLDDLLPATLVSLLKCIIIVSTALILGIIAVPAVLLLLPLVYYLFRRLTTFYQQTASQLKRLDKATTGPIISRFAETFSGLASVRALRLQTPLGNQLLAQLSANNNTHFLWTASGRWLAVRLDWVATSVVVAVGCGVVGFHRLDILTPSLAGLSLVYILQVSASFLHASFTPHA